MLRADCAAGFCYQAAGTLAMKRSTGTPVNLLPLLDVLLCTMGTLIVVLGVLNRLTRHAFG